MAKPSINAPNAGAKGFFSSINGVLSSVKFTIFILILIAAVSVIGTVIEQGQSPQDYFLAYGERWAEIILRLGLDRMYNTWWFVSILCLLVVNIIACTLDRFPPKWKTLLKEESASFNPALIDKLSRNATFTAAGDVQIVKNRISALLAKKKYKIKTAETPDGGFSIYAWKGVLGRFGSDFTHLSLLIILLGSIIGSVWGYKDFKVILVGDIVSSGKFDFQLRLDRFWVDYYDTGQIRQYNSILTVVEDGKDVLTKQIWVNEPLYYKGIRFYQSSYGTSWEKIKTAEIAFKRVDTEKMEDPVRLNWMELEKIPGTRYSAKLISYVADFAFDEATRTVYSKSGKAENPAIRLEVYDGDKLVAKPWLLFNYPSFVRTLPETNYDIIFTGFIEIPYSGVSVNKDPGTNVVWAGSLVMGAGFILAFFVFHRRIWVSALRARDGFTVKIGGMTNKNQLAFDKEFEEIMNGLKEFNTDAPSEAEGEGGR
ncbi:MAG TPA: cytochrome c biogenesis protein ResB [Thermodesulfobacteriota bacterium]|nr:cytochrome c biogenesis protein ResB [Thermodesulfobacteriota bacterium]